MSDAPSAERRLVRFYSPLSIGYAKIAAMWFKVEHSYRFDAAGKLDADDWVLIPRAQLRDDFVLDAAFADEMARRYFELVERSTPLLRVVRDAQGVRYAVPAGKTALLLADGERVVDAERAEISWRIAGGFLLAHHVNYGGRFYLGGEWTKPDALKLYTVIRRYPPRWTNWFGVALGSALYERTQGIAHKRMGETFLRALSADVSRAAP